MAGMPIRRARRLQEERLRREASIRAGVRPQPERSGQILRVGGMVLLTVLLVSWYLTWATAQVLLWCGNALAARLDLEDLLDRLPGGGI
jgi:hypothetical protein